MELRKYLDYFCKIHNNIVLDEIRWRGDKKPYKGEFKWKEREREECFVVDGDKKERYPAVWDLEVYFEYPSGRKKSVFRTNKNYNDSNEKIHYENEALESFIIATTMSFPPYDLNSIIYGNTPMSIMDNIQLSGFRRTENELNN